MAQAMKAPSQQSLEEILGQVSHQFGTDPSSLLMHLESLTSSVRTTKSFEELSPAIRDMIISVCDKCAPFVKIEHFDSGVRHWLVQIQVLFGEQHAVEALAVLKQAANLEGIRKMKAFITTRLIDHYEHLIWAQDPETYARGKLQPDMFAMLCELIDSGRGLNWSHFDPKVLDSMREVKSLDAIKARLHKLCVKELHGVVNVPAYLYTLLSKRHAAMNSAGMTNNASSLLAPQGLASQVPAVSTMPGSITSMGPQMSSNGLPFLNQQMWAANQGANMGMFNMNEYYVPINTGALPWGGNGYARPQFNNLMGYQQQFVPVTSMGMLSNAASGYGLPMMAAPGLMYPPNGMMRIVAVPFPPGLPGAPAIGAAV